MKKLLLVLSISALFASQAIAGEAEYDQPIDAGEINMGFKKLCYSTIGENDQLDDVVEVAVAGTAYAFLNVSKARACMPLYLYDLATKGCDGIDAEYGEGTCVEESPSEPESIDGR